MSITTQQLAGRNNLNAHQQMKGQTQCGRVINGTLFSHEKEQSANTGYNMDES